MDTSRRLSQWNSLPWEFGTGIHRQLTRVCRLCERSSYNSAGGGGGGEVCVGSCSAMFLEKEGVENWSERERGMKPSHTETD